MGAKKPKKRLSSFFLFRSRTDFIPQKVRKTLKTHCKITYFARSEKMGSGAWCHWCCQSGGQEGLAPLVRGSLPPDHQNGLAGDSSCYFFGAVAFARLGLRCSALSWGTQEAFSASTLCPNGVHLPILPPTSTLISHLGINFALNLPSKVIFY